MEKYEAREFLLMIYCTAWFKIDRVFVGQKKNGQFLYSRSEFNYADDKAEPAFGKQSDRRDLDGFHHKIKFKLCCTIYRIFFRYKETNCSSNIWTYLR